MVRTMATLTPMSIMTMFTHAEVSMIVVLEMILMTTTMEISDDGYVMIV